LGAAVWIIGMNAGKEGIEKIGYEDPRAVQAMERFLESADYEFECAKIVGRSFEGIDDHAAHVRAGGCSHIIEALAAKS
jgi:hypothetical protein